MPSMKDEDKILVCELRLHKGWGKINDIRVAVITDVKSLKVAIKGAWSKFSHRQINKTIDQWHPRLNQCIHNKGGHIEQYFVNKY